MTPKCSATFQIALLLKEPSDASGHDIGLVLSSICIPKSRGLGGGGGYRRGCKEPDKEDGHVVVLIFQKNDRATGDLADCTEEDRVHATRVLTQSALVDRFLVGPIHSGKRTFAQMGAEEDELVREFVRGWVSHD